MDDMARVGVPKDIAPLEVEIWLNENCDKLESCEPQVQDCRDGHFIPLVRLCILGDS